MKKIFLLLLLGSFTITNAQFWTEKISGNGHVVTEEREVGAFDKLTVTGAFNVKVVRGNSGIIKVTADENLLNIIETYTKSGGLTIRINRDFNLRRYTKLYVEVPAEYLSKIILTGSGKVYNDFPFDWNNIKLTLTGSGEMQFDLNIKHIKATLTGSGDIILSGKSETAKFTLTGSGEIDARHLVAGEAEAVLTGSGDIHLQAIEFLEAKIFGSGDIYYYGEPERLKSKSFGSGNINLRRL